MSTLTPTSSVLRPLDFFLWSYVKCSVYKNDSKSIPGLKDFIKPVNGEIETKLCQKIIENCNKRMDNECSWKRWSVASCLLFVNVYILHQNKLFFDLKNHLQFLFMSVVYIYVSSLWVVVWDCFQYIFPNLCIWVVYNIYNEDMRLFIN